MTGATAELQTRTSTQPFKREDIGYGWGRVCAEPSCRCRLNHFNPGKVCAPCETRLKAEGWKVPK